VSTDDPRGGDVGAPEAQANGGTPGGGNDPGTTRDGPRHVATRGTRRQRRHARVRARKHWKLRRALFITGLVVVLLVGAVGGYVLYLNAQVHRITVHHLKAAPTKGPDLGTENILMVGSTSRCALTVQNPAYGLCSQGVNGVNSDVILILHLNPAHKTVSVLSIPRDLFVPNARAEGANKIDAALFEGPSQLVAAIEEDFGIPIQHYVELNFDTFASVVDALGGVNMYFPMPVFDAYSGLNIQTPGCIHLDGYHALQVVRARHLQYKGPGVTTNDPYYWPQETESDLARIRRDHEFLRVLAAAVAQKGLGNPITDASLVSSVVGDLTVDSGFSSSHMVNLALTYHGINPFDAPQVTLPVMVSDINQYFYKGGAYGNVEFPIEPQDQQVIDQFLGDNPAANTLTGDPLPAPSSVSVAVLNGSGTSEAGTTVQAGLQALGFNVISESYTSEVGAQAETVVEYSPDTPAEEAAAQAVARSISGQVIMGLAPNSSTSSGATSSGAEVTVITGTDFSVNPPAPPPTTTTTTKARRHETTTTTSTTPTVPPTTSTTTTTTVPDFAPASPPVQALAPWDPRSCTAAGGEGP
jgi:LCP family protein required for cell wall assembly